MNLKWGQVWLRYYLTRIQFILYVLLFNLYIYFISDKYIISITLYPVLTFIYSLKIIGVVYVLESTIYLKMRV